MKNNQFYLFFVALLSLSLPVLMQGSSIKLTETERTESFTSQILEEKAKKIAQKNLDLNKKKDVIRLFRYMLFLQDRIPDGKPAIEINKNFFTQNKTLFPAEIYTLCQKHRYKGKESWSNNESKPTTGRFDVAELHQTLPWVLAVLLNQEKAPLDENLKNWYRQQLEEACKINKSLKNAEKLEELKTKFNQNATLRLNDKKYLENIEHYNEKIAALYMPEPASWTKVGALGLASLGAASIAGFALWKYFQAAPAITVPQPIIDLTTLQQPVMDTAEAANQLA